MVLGYWEMVIHFCQFGFFIQEKVKNAKTGLGSKKFSPEVSK